MSTDTNAPQSPGTEPGGNSMETSGNSENRATRDRVKCGTVVLALGRTWAVSRKTMKGFTISDGNVRFKCTVDGRLHGTIEWAVIAAATKGARHDGE